MPIYEYKCKKCGTIFDVYQKVGTSNEEIQCPQCGSKNPERLLSSFASTGSHFSSGCAPTSGFS